MSTIEIKSANNLIDGKQEIKTKDILEDEKPKSNHIFS